MAKIAECSPIKEEKINGLNKWDVENACDCLMKAEAHKKDPKMMAAIKKIMKQRMNGMKNIMSIEDIEEARDEAMNGEED